VLEALPLFPLGHAVLFPGMPLALHVFEDRYRELVRMLVGKGEGEPRRFGVIAIRQGWEVGADAVRALHPVGCAAEVRRVSRYPDGRFDLATVGGRRFRLAGVDDRSRPYLVGQVEWLPADPADDGTGRQLSVPVTALFGEYVAAAGVLRGEAGALRGAAVGDAGEGVTDLPVDPSALSYLVASSAVLSLDDRQALLEASSATDRLRAELRMLKRETTMVRRLRALPVPVADLQVSQSLS
jgi:Lon protease-like protein